tara:strand:+ start:405 stop:689 length:285 start_codon:yes stop_codon:yes gene_type:complete
MALKVHLEIKTDESFSPRNEYVDSFDEAQLNILKEKFDAEGRVHSWLVSEELPYDEGYRAAMDGEASEKNPYAEHFWKHNEWWLGWDAYHESND